MGNGKLGLWWGGGGGGGMGDFCLLNPTPFSSYLHLCFGTCCVLPPAFVLPFFAVLYTDCDLLDTTS